MTITKTQWRVKDDGYVSPIDKFEVKSIADALESLVVYELGYGGNVIDLTETKVSILTNVMGCKDSTIFEGPKEEMQSLVEIALLGIYSSYQRLLLKEDRDEWEDKRLEKMTERVIKVTKGSPLLINLASDMILGDFSMKACMISGLNNCRSLTVDEIKYLGLSTAKDLFAIYSLVKAEGCSLDDALTLVS